MKNKQKRLSAVIGVVLMMASVLGGCTAETAKVDDIQFNPNINQYTIQGELNPIEKTLTATQQVNYINTENVELKELYFHVYANAFKKPETAPFAFDSIENVYRTGFIPGYTDMASVEAVQGTARTPLSYNLQGEGETILKVTLQKPLKPSEAVTLNMSYKVHIPPVDERFGWGENYFNLGNWYPIAAVYDKTGWNLDKYYPIGDPFYSDVANYNVQIKAPAEYTVAASGELLGEQQEGADKVWKFRAANMRDFAFIANNDFKVIQRKVGDTIVKSYYYSEHETKGKQALKIATKAIEVFNKKFGKYPYPTYSVVETVFPTGMEYPGLVYISTNYYKPNRNPVGLNLVIVHETGHQWWYGLVGNDQIDEAWLDEGFTTYSEKVMNEVVLGKREANEIFEKYVEDRSEGAYDTKNIDGVVVKPLSGFKDMSKDYAPTVYSRGAVVLNELRKEVGDRVFFKILKTYFKQYEYKIATTEDFIGVAAQVSGKNLDKFFDKWLYNKQ